MEDSHVPAAPPVAPTARRRRAYAAYSSAFLGLSSLLGVLCFHFPELLTSQEFRQVYTERFARNLLLLGLVLAFALGTYSLLRGRARRVSLLGIAAATLAVLLGGATVQLEPSRQE